MKIAISGKGGVGKSTLAGTLAVMFAERGDRVLALDTDPDANLAHALGISESEQRKIRTVSDQIGLIEERTGAKVGQYGQLFSLNPDVSDVADRYAFDWRGVSLVVLGAARRGGGGCACPENTFIRALVMSLVLARKETLIMDMEAGIEHLGRGTAQGVDCMLVVVEPGQRAVDCALQVERMCREIGLRRILFVGSKTGGPEDEAFLRSALTGRELIGCIPYSEALRRADRDGICVRDCLDAASEKVTEDLINYLNKEVGK